MAYDDRKTTSLVRLNSKISAINQLKLEFGSVDVPEGRFVKKDAAGKAVFATNTDYFTLLNFLDTLAGSSKTQTQDKFDATAPTISQSSGGLTGIVGNGTPIGIPVTEWDTAVMAPAAGNLVTVGTSGKPRAMEIPGGGVDPIPTNRPFFGTIYEVSLGIAWFIYRSIGTPTGV